MPLKSKAQVRKWAELVKEGKIKESTFKEAVAATPPITKLPERVRKKTLSALRRDIKRSKSR